MFTSSYGGWCEKLKCSLYWPAIFSSSDTNYLVPSVKLRTNISLSSQSVGCCSPILNCTNNK